MDALTYLVKIQEQAFFADEKTKGSLRWHTAWYRKRAPVRRWLFRLSGSLVIVVSVSLPFYLSLITEIERAAGAVTAAWIIALLTGLNGFFGWNKTWQGYIEAQLKLEGIWSIWELESTLIVASGRKDATEELERLARSTVTDAMNAVIQETRGYFSQVKFPETRADKDSAVGETPQSGTP